MIMKQYEIDLHSLIPRIKRARGYYLFDFKGTRFVDCFQGNGSFILGHRFPGLTTALKNVLSAGLLSDLPSKYTRRLMNALKAQFPEYRSFIIESDYSTAFLKLKQLTGVAVEKKDIQDPLFMTNNSRNAFISVWRPFLDEEVIMTEALIALLPFGVSHAPCVICLKQEAKAEDPALLSPFILAGLTKSIYGLRDYRIPDWVTGDFLKESDTWTRKGMYIVPRFGKEEFTGIYTTFLNAGIILSPYFPGQSILPREISKGEYALLNKLLLTKI